MNDEKNFNKFIILWLTQSLSRLGSSLTPFALVLWSYEKTESALATALLTVSTYIPYILFSLPVGTIVDKVNKKKLLVISDSLAALGTVIIFMLYLHGSLELWHLYLVNAFSGLTQTFQAPASEVAVTLVTPEDKYQKAGAMNAFTYSIVNVLSPVLATSLYAVGGLKAVITVDLLTFLVAFISLIFLVKIPEKKKDEKKRDSMFSSLKGALGFLRNNIGILEVILFLGAINFIASIYNAALPAMVLSFENESVLATVQAAAGMAMIIGSIISTLLPSPKNRVKVIVVCLFVSMSSENFMLSFSRNPISWIIGAFLGWICIPIMNTNLDSLLRSKIPEEVQGRVYSARNVFQFFTIPLGYLCGGLLVDRVFEPFMEKTKNALLTYLFGHEKGSGAAFLFAVIGFMGVIVCIVFSRMKEMRRLDT